ncbi:short-chain dehydrogenase/reductase SDR [Mycolicibacterium canariasense]|uniref:Short-chain dehydrogenase/reductase SDR n=1 Tax=Mycolicibacterium canariasense TaxID=228230 RepID=A0A124E2G1_MYCCR|nr:SDR family oxidoreductase [Mycolicibacterium canariasense]MCV7210058.1 SDR family oxidoreductase [Mycolicibacterium canariasense]ORV04712.1 oxidoreductase [Mycolicibacterium canariasense]GAS96695.1 short-chain dehydrogenase/reductase SDR [Mycolicibacterium canariasense]
MVKPFRASRALITGASSGIGEAFAQALAQRGCDLVLVARRRDRLEALADQLEAKYGISCTRIAFDLSVEAAGSRLRQLVEGDIDLVINNAGFATQGPFLDGDARDYARVLAVDIGAVVDICHAFLPKMVQRRHGAIMNICSTTAYQPVPSLAVYAASKSFVLSFSQSLWYEAKRHGVKVFSFAPGPTRTEFFDVIGETATVVGRMQTADQVAAAGLRALDRRRTPPSAVSGTGNTVSAALARLVPRRVLMPALARSLRPLQSQNDPTR